MEKIIHFVWHPEEWIKAYKEMQYNKNFLLDFYKNKEEEVSGSTDANILVGNLAT